MNDILTIVWKEMKELLQMRGRMRGGVFGLLIFTLAFGVLLPLQTGTAWVTSAVNLLYWAWVPYLLVISVIADAFAGERERHTLETLLASRLSDRAILYGKLAASLLYGWGLTMINVLVGLITINIAFAGEGLVMFPPDLMLAVVFLTLGVAAFAAALGVNVSLRAPTVRQAQQTLSMVMFAVMIPLLVLPMLPEDWRARIGEFLMGAMQNGRGILGGTIIALLIVDAALLWLAQRRFRRTRLILD